MSEIIRLADVAEELGLHHTTLRRWVEQGKGPRYLKTPGGVFLFRRQEVDAWIRSLEGPVDTEESDEL